MATPLVSATRSNADEERRRRTPTGAAVLRQEVTTAIVRACFREWARTGYAALTMEAVARRAGVGKAALYRRWPSKLALVTDLLTQAGTPPADIPDQGSLTGDVRLFLRQTQRLLQRPLVRRILPDLHAEMGRTPELAAAVRNGLQKERRELGGRLLDRAVARGELGAGIDRDLALDLLGAPLYWRAVITGGPTSPDYLEALTALTVGGLRALGSARP